MVKPNVRYAAELNRSYKSAFAKYVRQQMSILYEALKPWYQERSKDNNPDSLAYFHAHWDRFEKMILLCLRNGIKPLTLSRICEVGSFYPYVSYFFKQWNPDISIDLFDIVLREIGLEGPVDTGEGTVLYDFNVSIDTFPTFASYDLVFCSEVLEHLATNIYKVAEKVQSIVATDGHLVVTYPMGPGKRSPFNAQEYDKDYDDRDPEFLQEDHVSEFAPETTEFFFTDMKLVESVDFRSSAYGKMRACLYQA